MSAEIPPIGMELGRAPGLPEFDPHEGREFGDQPEAMIGTMVFVGLDRGGDFEDCIQQIVTLAESMGLRYVTASIAELDIGKMNGDMLALWNEIRPLPEPE